MIRQLKIRRYAVCLAISALAWIAALPLSAQTSSAPAGNAVLDLLLRKGVINQQEATAAREQIDAEAAQSLQQFNKIKSAGWLQALTLSGDFRLRSDFVVFENDPATGQALNPDILRFTFRLRVGAELKLQDWATVGLRLTTGMIADSGGLTTNPDSASQFMTDDFSRKPFGLDMAYVAIQAPESDAVRLLAGKMPNPIWEPVFGSPLEWDPDLTPEGLGEQLQYKCGDQQQYRFFVQAGQFVLNEFGNDTHDIYLFDQQIGLETKLNDHWKATLAGGYYATKNLRQLSAVVPSGSPAAATYGRGNATYSLGGKSYYLDDFNVVYGKGELVYTINDQTFFGTPNKITLAGEYMRNTARYAKSLARADQSVDADQREGYTAQIAYGDNQKMGQWQITYQYKVLQADATWDGLADDAFGTTDRQGHYTEALYNLRDWWQLRMCCFLTEKISNRPNTGHNMIGFAGQQMIEIELDNLVKF